MIKPTKDYILVRIKKETLSKGGLALTNENQRQEYGTIVVSGDPDFKKGEIAYFKSYSGIPITLDKEELFFVKTDEILATA